MIAAPPIEIGVDPLAWKILSRIEIGPVEVSPHGIGIAVGFLLAAQFMMRGARRAGGPDENLLWNAVMVALVGALVGARAGYVIGHFSEVTDGGDDLLGIVRVWEGGISLIGGIAGGVAAAAPYLRRHGVALWPTLDLAAPGMALGIAVGRIGDLVIGDHLGKPTTFALGWRCLGDGGSPPRSAAQYAALDHVGPEAPTLGCYDVVVHQTALYDMIGAWLLFAALVWLSRRVDRAGVIALSFGLGYGALRFGTDFLRSDRRYAGLTGSQIVALVVVLLCYYLLVRHRGAPTPTTPAEDKPTTDGDEDPPKWAPPGIMR